MCVHKHTYIGACPYPASHRRAGVGVWRGSEIDSLSVVFKRALRNRLNRCVFWCVVDTLAG